MREVQMVPEYENSINQAKNGRTAVIWKHSNGEWRLEPWFRRAGSHGMYETGATPKAGPRGPIRSRLEPP